MGSRNTVMRAAAEAQSATQHGDPGWLMSHECPIIALPTPFHSSLPLLDAPRRTQATNQPWWVGQGKPNRGPNPSRCGRLAGPMGSLGLDCICRGPHSAGSRPAQGFPTPVFQTVLGGRGGASTAEGITHAWGQRAQRSRASAAIGRTCTSAHAVQPWPAAGVCGPGGAAGHAPQAPQ